MNAMRKLHFLPRGIEAFSDHLHALWGEGIRSIYVIGEPDWVAALQRAAAGIALQPWSDVQSLAHMPGSKAVVFGETDGEKLGGRLVSCAALDDVIVVAPITDWYFAQKPLFLVSVPKAGTHLLYELARALGYDEGVECPEFPLGKTWYCLEYSNSHTVARDFFVDTVRRAPFGNRQHSFMRSPTLFMYRHPLDILVSEAHYYHGEGKTVFAGWLNQCNFDERIERLIHDNWLMGSLRERIGGFLPWLEFPNVIPLSFEQLVGADGGASAADQRDLIWSIQLKLQAPGDADAIAAGIFNPHSATFRAGQVGAYRNQITAKTVTSWANANADILAALGYPSDGSFALPADRAERLTRPIRYSRVEAERIPVTIEADFLGCNLVRYGDRIYAVPRAAGAIALDGLPAAVLADLPSARSIGEIKSLLLVGRETLADRIEALEKLAARLRGEGDAAAVHCYWRESVEPAVLENYNGFNVVAYRGRFYGLRQSLGAVDFSDDPSELVRRFSVDDVVVCASISALHAEIDGLATAVRARKETRGWHEQALALVGALEARLAAQEDRLASQQSQIASQESRIASEESRLGAQEDRIAAQEDRLGAQEDRLGALERRLVSLEDRMERVQSWATAIGKLEERQAVLAKRCAEMDARLGEVESSWPMRFTRMVTRAIRGRT